MPINAMLAETLRRKFQDLQDQDAELQDSGGDSSMPSAGAGQLQPPDDNQDQQPLIVPPPALQKPWDPGTSQPDVRPATTQESAQADSAWGRDDMINSMPVVKRPQDLGGAKNPGLPPGPVNGPDDFQAMMAKQGGKEGLQIAPQASSPQQQPSVPPPPAPPPDAWAAGSALKQLHQTPSPQDPVDSEYQAPSPADPAGIVAKAAMGAKNIGPIAATKKHLAAKYGKPKGIGLGMTSDRHASLLDQAPPAEVPQQTSDEPQDKVDNKNLAASQNALSAAVTTQDVQKATEREHPPQDRSGYYAALREMAQGAAIASGVNDPTAGSYYSAKITSEERAQKDWRAKTEAMAKEKFQSGEKEKDRAVTSAHNTAMETQNALNAKDLAQNRIEQAKDRDADRASRDLNADALRKVQAQRININVGGQQERFNERMTQDAIKRLPGADELANFNDVLATLDEGKAPGTGYFMNKGGWQNFLRSPEGQNFRVKVLSVLNPAIKRIHGAQVTPGEEVRAMGQYGYGSFDSPEALADGMHALEKAYSASITRDVGGQSSDVQQNLRDRGVIPQIGGKFGKSVGQTATPEGAIQGMGANGVTEPNPSGAFGPSFSDAKGLIDIIPTPGNIRTKLYNWAAKNFTQQDATQMAKDKSDEEKRKQARKQSGLSVNE